MKSPYEVIRVPLMTEKSTIMNETHSKVSFIVERNATKPEIAKAVSEIKAGKVEFRVDKTGIVHAPCGKIQFDEKNLYENAKALIEAVIRAKPASSKGKYIRSISISSTMSPGIWVDETSIEAHA